MYKNIKESSDSELLTCFVGVTKRKFQNIEKGTIHSRFQY